MAVVLVDDLRAAIGQEKGGHISPVAAYDADTDRFLILDVSRYKYPPIWVEAADLFAAMNTTDSTTPIRPAASSSSAADDRAAGSEGFDHSASKAM